MKNLCIMAGLIQVKKKSNDNLVFVPAGASDGIRGRAKSERGC